MDAFVIRHKRKSEHEDQSSKFAKKADAVPHTVKNPPNDSSEAIGGAAVDQSGFTFTSCAASVSENGSMGSNDQHSQSAGCLEFERIKSLKWRRISKENLNCDYCKLYSRNAADALFRLCEQQMEYNTGDLAKVQVFGKWHDIPRKQVAYGDAGLTYKFSGNEVPARPWPWFVAALRDTIQEVTGQVFNFVLVNRYADGSDHMGEHRDDEKELVVKSPIASLSLGQARDFIFRHADSRGKNATRKIDPVTIELEHGGLLMMNYPTNTFWYHSLPKRKKATGVRINFTFRHFVMKPSNV